MNPANPQGFGDKLLWISNNLSLSADLKTYQELS